VASFEILEEEGMRYVRVQLQDETVRAESGALAFMRGSITMKARIPSVAAVLRSSLSEERAVRPTFTGTGELVLESTLGGYFIFEPHDEPWIIEAGAYWASDGSIELGVHRERVLTSFWAGEGFVDFCTKVKGQGKVVLMSPGPVQEVDIPSGEEMAVEGKLVIGRTASIRYSIRRPTRSILGSVLSGEKALRVYKGPGRVLISSTPYWNSFLLARLRAR
jgi:uncharacterized protein (AIM24 family)